MQDIAGSFPADLTVLSKRRTRIRPCPAVFNVAGVPAPAEAVIARTVDEVRSAARYAAAVGRPVRVLSTGHGSMSRGAMDDALLIRVELTVGLRIDPTTRTAWVPAGTPWGGVVTAAAAYGLTAMHGSSPTVGAVGYLLHGGLSFYGRRHGVAANSVRSIELVTATGDHIRVDAEHHAELFWALRGGGGGFGVVTAVEIELIPVVGTISGSIVWPAESPTPVHASHRLLDALPDATVEKLVDTTGPGSQSPMMVVELRQLGGAFADPLRLGGAFDRIDRPWLYYAAGVAFDTAATESIAGQFSSNSAVLAAHTTRYTIPPFAEDAAEHQQSFGLATARAVNTVRQSYDPDGLFRGDVAVGSTYALGVSPERRFHNLYHDLQETSSNATAQD